ncbi:ribonuclease HII [Psychrobacter alimentarius]|uniref:ribonuclease HII n=1 Tax=Psychrobacter alimentarius TaxID=261164 RepID=UPI003FD36022
MSNQHSTKNSATPFDVIIENIDIKGQYIHLAEAVHLSGQLNVSELRAQYLTSSEEDLALQMGVDEAGRGPLLGSVNVAAAILPSAWAGLIENQPLKDTPLSILTDSKQLSEKKRDVLYPLVQKYAMGYVVADVPAAVIDQINILQATMLGMRLCTEVLLEMVAPYLMIDNADSDLQQKSHTCVQVLFDGNRCPDLDEATLEKVGIKKSAIDSQAWVKGDARHTSIAAASILAKVSRDKTMYTLDNQYPEYGIAKHKGYPTKAHMEAIAMHGILPAHRRSFAPVRKVLEN